MSAKGTSASGISALFSESYTEDPTTKHRRLTARGWITISAVVAGFLVFTFTDFVERQEKVVKAAQAQAQITSLQETVGSQKQLLNSQQKVLDNQTRELTLQEQQLTRLRRLDLGRWMLGGVRLSWTADQKDLEDLKTLIERAFSDNAEFLLPRFRQCFLEAADSSGSCSVDIHGSSKHEAFISYLTPPSISVLFHGATKRRLREDKVEMGLYNGVDDSYWESILLYLTKRICRQWTLLASSDAELLKMDDDVMKRSVLRIHRQRVIIDSPDPGIRLDQLDSGPVRARFIALADGFRIGGPRVRLESTDPSVNFVAEFGPGCTEIAKVPYSDEKGNRGFEDQCTTAPTRIQLDVGPASASKRGALRPSR